MAGAPTRTRTGIILFLSRYLGYRHSDQRPRIIPILGTVPIGLGIIYIFTPMSTYLLDAYPDYSASAIAASTVLRSLFSAFLPLAGPPMYARLGLGWGNSLLAFIALALGGVPLLFCRYGQGWREGAKLVL